MNINPQNIILLLREVVSDNASSSQITELVRVAHHIAVTRLKQMVSSGKLHLQSFPLSLESVAFDCIAELFARNEQQQFVELKEYFIGEQTLDKLNEEAVQHFRALVFRTLHDGIFRLYRENDPILSKILRNIKIAIHKESTIQEYDRFGITHLFSCSLSERNDNLPGIEVEEVERLLSGMTSSGINAHRYLLCIFDFLNSQETYRRSISLIDIAIVYKRLLLKNNEFAHTVDMIDSEVLSSDTLNIVTTSINIAEKNLRTRYVNNGKITSEIFNQYFSAINEILQDTFIHNDGSTQSYFDYLIVQIPDLEYEEYRLHHRSHFEYMVKLAKNIVKKHLMSLL